MLDDRAHHELLERRAGQGQDVDAGPTGGLGPGPLPGDHDVADRQGDEPRDEQGGGRGHLGPVPPGPSDDPGRQGVGVGFDGLVAEPSVDVFGQGQGRRVSAGGLGRHRLDADRLQGPGDFPVDLPRLPVEPGGDLARVAVGERGLAGQEVIERGPQAEDVGRRADLVDLAGGLLGAHVLQGPQGPPSRVGSTPETRTKGAGSPRRGRPAPVDPPAVGRPIGLARPQSTTRVSPNLPSMMLPGLRSRWRTPRLWAYSIALQTSTNLRRSLRSARSLAPGSSGESSGGPEVDRPSPGGSYPG